MEGWLLLAIIPAAIFAAMNLMDKIILNKKVSPWTYQALIVLSNVPMIAVVLLFFPINFNQTLALGVGAFGALNFFSFWSYMNGMQREEASRVISMLYIYPVFTAIMSALLIGEVLKPAAYVGLALLVLSATLVSFKPGIKGRWLSPALGYITIWALAWSAYLVFLKTQLPLYDSMSIFFWAIVGGWPPMVILMLSRKIRANFVREIKGLSLLWLAARFGAAFVFLGASLMSYEAFRQAPASLVASVAATQPSFGLLYSALIAVVAPKLANEHFDRRTAVFKVAAVILIIAGVWLVSY